MDPNARFDAAANGNRDRLQRMLDLVERAKAERATLRAERDAAREDADKARAETNAALEKLADYLEGANQAIDGVLADATAEQTEANA